MAYIVMAYTVMAYTVIAYIVTAYRVMALAADLEYDAIVARASLAPRDGYWSFTPDIRLVLMNMYWGPSLVARAPPDIRLVLVVHTRSTMPLAAYVVYDAIVARASLAQRDGYWSFARFCARVRTHEKQMPYRLYIGIADGLSIARVWACRYSK